MEQVIEGFKDLLISEGREETTSYAYEGELSRFMNWYIGKVEDITYKVIDNYLLYLAKEKNPILGLSARLRTRSVLRKLLWFLRREEIIPSTSKTDPENILKIRKPPVIIAATITELELWQILKAILLNHNDFMWRDLAILSTAFYTGLRPFELIRMKDSWIKEKELTVKVLQGKGLKDRITVINKFALLFIKKYLRNRKGTIFLSKNLKPFTTSKAINNIIQRIKKLEPSLNPETTAYSLRRGFACYFYLLTNYNIKLLQLRMGHNSITTTERYIEYVVDYKAFYDATLDELQQIQQSVIKAVLAF